MRYQGAIMTSNNADEKLKVEHGLSLQRQTYTVEEAAKILASAVPLHTGKGCCQPFELPAGDWCRGEHLSGCSLRQLDRMGGQSTPSVLTGLSVLVQPRRCAKAGNPARVQQSCCTSI
jgi:hypothetical protein